MLGDNIGPANISIWLQCDCTVFQRVSWAMMIRKASANMCNQIQLEIQYSKIKYPQLSQHGTAAPLISTPYASDSSWTPIKTKQVWFFFFWTTLWFIFKTKKQVCYWPFPPFFNSTFFTSTKWKGLGSKIKAIKLNFTINLWHIKPHTVYRLHFCVHI